MEGDRFRFSFFVSSILSNMQIFFSQSETIRSLLPVNFLALNAEKVFGIRSSEYRIPDLLRSWVPAEPEAPRSSPGFSGNWAGDGKTTHKVGKGQGSRNAR
jgi:hypothetical protein